MNISYIGIDNGSTGNICILHYDKPAQLFPTPVKKVLNYTKEKSFVTRIDVIELENIFRTNILSFTPVTNIKLAIERPFLNPKMFKASVSSIRAMESTLVILEKLELPYQFEDSKRWQAALLPSGLKGDELKIASKEVATRMFPHLKDKIKKDGDSILLAEWLRRQDLRKEL